MNKAEQREFGKRIFRQGFEQGLEVALHICEKQGIKSLRSEMLELGIKDRPTSPEESEA